MKRLLCLFITLIPLICGCSFFSNEQISSYVYKGKSGYLSLKLNDIYEEKGKVIIYCEYVNISDQILWVDSMQYTESFESDMYILPCSCGLAGCNHVCMPDELGVWGDTLALSMPRPEGHSEAPGYYVQIYDKYVRLFSGYDVPIYYKYVRLFPGDSIGFEYIIPNPFKTTVINPKGQKNVVIRFEDIKKLYLVYGVYKLDLSLINAEKHVIHKSNNRVLISRFWEEQDKEIWEEFQFDNPIAKSAN